MSVMQTGTRIKWLNARLRLSYVNTRVTLGFLVMTPLRVLTVLVWVTTIVAAGTVGVRRVILLTASKACLPRNTMVGYSIVSKVILAAATKYVVISLDVSKLVHE